MSNVRQYGNLTKSIFHLVAISLGDPKSRNGGMAEWRNGGMAEWRNGGMAENDPKS